MTEGDFDEAATAANVAAKLLVNALKPKNACITSAADAAAVRACAVPVIKERGEFLFRRPLTDDEVALYADGAVANFGKVDGGSEGAIRLAFEGMLLAPQFLFRVEAGGSNSRLTPYELASAISYTLMQRPPDVPLWEAAKNGQLATPEQVKAQVERILTARIAKLATEDYLNGNNGDYPELRFLRELFRWEVQPIKSDQVVHPDGSGFMPDRSIWDTTETVKLLLKNNGRKDFLKQLLTTRTFIIRSQTQANWGPSLKSQLKSDVNTQFNQTVTAPATERAGILSTPAFLSAWSAFDHNQPVQRGRFVRERLLCTKVPELPIGQVPPLPDLGDRSRMRDRLKIHSSTPGCAACHQFMDPMGLTFEQYDDTGLLRGSYSGSHPTTSCCGYKGLIDEKGPIDITGGLVGAGPVDGPITGGLPELAEKLAQSPVVEQCFVRQSFRYWLGREEVVSDACTLKAAQDAYVKSGGDFVALVAALIASPANLVRSAK